MAVGRGHSAPVVARVNDGAVVGGILAQHVVQRDEHAFLAELEQLVRGDAALEEHFRVIAGIQGDVALLVILGQVGVDHLEMDVGLFLHPLVDGGVLELVGRFARTAVHGHFNGLLQGEGHGLALLGGGKGEHGQGHHQHDQQRQHSVQFHEIRSPFILSLWFLHPDFLVPQISLQVHPSSYSQMRFRKERYCSSENGGLPAR